MTATGHDVERRILIVDDDEMISAAASQQLTARGFAVDVATEPEHASLLLERNAYALVLLDAYMTGQLLKGAGELVDRVVALRGNAHLILASAYGSEDLVARVRAAGATTIVKKPISVRMLVELLEGFLGTGGARPN